MKTWSLVWTLTLVLGLPALAQDVPPQKDAATDLKVLWGRQ